VSTPAPRLFSDPLAIAALVSANALPVIGVLVWNWDLRLVMLTYWAESAVIGLFAILRMLYVGGLIAVPPAVFFCVHFGGFMAGHLVFLLVLTAPGGLAGVGGTSPGLGFHRLPGLLAEPLVIATLAAMVISHGLSFVMNFLLGGEAARTTVSKEMGAPYGRIIIMHVAIIAGAFLVILIGSPTMLLVLLIALKTGFDLFAHGREHRKRQERLEPPVNADERG